MQDLTALVISGLRFHTIYADPPWPYRNQASRGASSNHYESMSLDEICALPLELLAARNAHLHLWVTSPFLFEAKRVIEAWGFEYKGGFAWVKPRLGLGNYWRNSHEILLLGVRGNAPFEDWTLQSWGLYERGRHSEKPEEVRGLIERASPAPRLELFARKVSPVGIAGGMN